MRHPGIEPGLSDWKSDVATTGPMTPLYASEQFSAAFCESGHVPVGRTMRKRRNKLIPDSHCAGAAAHGELRVAGAIQEEALRNADIRG